MMLQSDSHDDKLRVVAVICEIAFFLALAGVLQTSSRLSDIEIRHVEELRAYNESFEAKHAEANAAHRQELETLSENCQDGCSPDGILANQVPYMLLVYMPLSSECC